MSTTTPSEFQVRVPRSSFDAYFPWLQDAEYRLLKQVIVDMLAPVVEPADKLLDVACWDGEATRFYGRRLGITDLHGVDYTQVAEARERGVQVLEADLEQGAFPYEDDTFDVVVANQIFEHLKQIYRPLSEIHRILKPGGHLLFSVPNLAALHCRVQLALGIQPSTIQLFEAHVRGFTHRTMRPFLTHNGLFTIEDWRGSGLYPLPPSLSQRLSRPLRSISVYQLYLLRKTDVEAPDWQAEVLRRGVQSNF